MTYRDQLTDLLAGPYAGYGGVRALAADLSIHVQTLKVWRMEGHQAPSYANRQRIASLWSEKCGGAA